MTSLWIEETRETIQEHKSHLNHALYYIGRILSDHTPADQSLPDGGAEEDGVDTDIVPDLTHKVQLDKSVLHPQEGGFGQVYRGLYKPDNGQRIAIKVALVPHQIFDFRISNEEVRGVAREITMMRKLRHPNILPLLGTARVQIKDERPSVCILSPWMDNGDMTAYLINHPNLDPLPILVGVALALTYMHDLDPVAVHGDVKAANVLIDAQGNALLGDFGLARKIDAQLLERTPPSVYQGTYAFIAPERINPQEFGIDIGRAWAPPADVFSFAMLIYEALTRKGPYYDIPGARDDARPAWVLMKNVLGERPTILDEWLNDPLKRSVVAVMQACWSQHPGDRPHMVSVLERLQMLQMTSQNHSQSSSQEPPEYDPADPWPQPAGTLPNHGRLQQPPSYGPPAPWAQQGGPAPQQVPGYGPPPQPVQQAGPFPGQGPPQAGPGYGPPPNWAQQGASFPPQGASQQGPPYARAPNRRAGSM